MSYMKSSYKSSSYRFSSSSGEGTSSSSRLRGTADDGESSLATTHYSTRRSFNLEDSSEPSSTANEDYGSLRSTRQSFRLSSRYSTDSDLDSTDKPSSRFTSKYKSLLSADDDDEDFSVSRSYSRYSSRDEGDNGPSSTSRITRYSTIENDDDYGLTSSTRRHTSRLSYLGEDSDGISSASKSYTRRYADLRSESFKSSYDESYKVTSPIDEESKSFSSVYSGGDSGADTTIKRRYQSTSSSRSLTRLDSKDAGQVYEAILDYKPPRSATDEICLKEGQEVVVLSKDKPHKWKVRTRRSKNFTKVEEGFAPSAYLKAKNESVDMEITELSQEQPKDEQANLKDLKKKKDMIVRELIETEEDLIRDMQFVQRTYIRQSESSITPKEIKAVKDVIFGCFKELLAFHRDVLLKNFQTLSKEPTKIGTLFLKLKSDFDNHNKYCTNLPKALEILDENSDVNEFFNNYAVKVRDEKTLTDHLKLPLQRINDYQLLLKELSKHLSRMDENVDDLEKAIKLIATIPEEKTDQDDEEDDDDLEPKVDKAEIKPFNANLPGECSDKLSKLLKNVLQAKDYFDVTESDGKTSEQFIFLFKSRMFITEINKNISESQRTYNVKKIIKLPEVEVCADEDNAKALVIKSKDISDKSYPIRLQTKTADQAKSWLDLINHSSKFDEDNGEQSLLEEECGMFVQEDGTRSLPNKSDQNLPKANKEVSTDQSGVDSQKTVGSSDHSSGSVSNTIDGTLSNLDETEKSTTAGNAEILDDLVTEATTLATENLRSESFSSVDAPEKAFKAASQIEKDACSTNICHSEKLQIIHPLRAVTKHVGEVATLQCKVSPGTTNVQWLKDNKVLSGSNCKTSQNDDTHFLEVSNLSPEDAGLYTIVASNSKESVASSSTLNVLSVLGDSRPTSPGGSFLPHPPKFKVKLKDTELLEGTTVRFELIVRGLPIPHITFFKDGKPLVEDDHLKILFQSKEVFEIIIEHVRLEDAGVYKCVATNTEGEDETSGRIIVSSDKNVFWGLDEDETKTVIEDNIISPRSRSPLFKWFKDGQEFEASERFQVQFDDQEDTIALIFQHVKPDDAGLYTCVASTSSGKISCSAELTVQGLVRELAQEPIAPTIKKELTNINVSKGESVAILEAQISGYPKPKIAWFKDNEQLASSEHYKMLYEGDENYALIIKNVKNEDAGQYKLKATNELGTAESSAELTVCTKPKIQKINDKIEVMSNDQLIIEATYESVPAPKVKWMKDGKEIKQSEKVKSIVENDKIKLVIEKATSEDTGKYKCLISNDLGKDSADVDVSVKSPPKFVKKLQALEVWEEETAIFVMQCSGEKVKVEFYQESKLIKNNERIQIKEEENGTFKLIINKAQQDDKGKYKCVIKNEYGVEEDSAELTIKKKDAAPVFKEKLNDIEASVNDENVKLAVKVDGSPKPTCKWYHNGNEIAKEDKRFKILDDDQGSALIIPKVLNEHHGVYVCKSENVSGKGETSANLIVKSPPYVVKHLENIDSSIDLDVKLQAIIKGNPTPKVKWFLGDKEIKMDNRRKYSYDEATAEYTLYISKMQKEDFGTYKIEAENVHGKCSSSAKVELVSKPLFTKVLQNITAKEMDSNIELVVQVDKQTCKPLVKWFKNDKEITDNDKNYKKVEGKLDNSYKLVILKATEEMVGKYKCIVSNDFGTTETAAKFDVITKPKFIKGLEDLQVMEGSNVSMTVKIAGFPKPEVAFFKDGQDVSTEATIVVKKEIDDIYVLEIENIRIIMSGEYECRIRNEAGEASSKGVITVNGKPKIVKDLADQTVNVGEDVSLEVVITGKPFPEVKWFVNGKETSGNERILLDAKEEIYKLKIPNALESDSAVYHCSASNKFGKATSEKSKVQVIKQEYAPNFTKRLEDALVVVNDNVRFEAVVSAIPECKVTWSKDGIQLNENDKVEIRKEGEKDVLILKNLKLDDSGVIACKAQNAKGFVSDTAKLTVQEPTLPSISGLSDVSVVDGEPVKIEAMITGFPKPSVSWYKEGEYVDSQLVYSEPQNDRYLLSIKSISSDLAGKYTCSATNCAGEALENFNIEICGKKPSFTKELEESIVMSVGKEKNKLKLGQNAIFETIVDGIPTPEVTWLKDDKELHPNDRITINNIDDEHKLEIKEITKNDVAKYTCKAANIYGEALSVCLLKFLNEPHEPIIKKPLEDIKIEEGDTLKLLCKVDGEPMPAVKWFKDEDLVGQNDRIKLTSKGDGTASLLIEEVVKEDSGVYEVRAENVKGVASSSAKVLVEKPKRPPKFTKPLNEEIKIEFNDTLVLEASVFGLPTPQIEWLKDGKPINKTKDERVKIAFDNGDCKLTIDKVKLNDSGCYELKSTNPSGEAITSTKVKVMPEPYAPLIIDNLPVKVQVVVGEQIELHSKIEAYPLPKVTWMKDHKPICEDDRIKCITKPDGNISLSINPVKASDAGEYAITAENPIGEVTTSTKVNVVSPSYAEKITKTLPDKIEVVQGQKPIVLEAKVENASPADVYWVKDGNIVQPNDSVKLTEDKGDYKLVVENPLTSDSGTYSLVVKSPEGKFETKSDVQVLEKPLIANEPTATEELIKVERGLPSQLDVVQGQDLQLSLKLTTSDLPNDRIHVYKDEIPLSKSDVSKLVKNDSGEIKLLRENCTDKDSGTYRIEIEMPSGNISNSCLVQVIDKEQTQGDIQSEVEKPVANLPKLKKELESIEVVSGNPCRLECIIDGNPSEFYINWFKDDEEVVPNEHYGLVKEPDGTIALLIDSFSAKDAGNYKVVVKNDAGLVSSTGKTTLKAELSQTKPTFIDGLQTTSLVEKSPLSLKAKIVPLSSSPSEVKWFKDNIELKESDTTKFFSFPDGTIMLTIGNIEMKDAGTYKVTVSNQFGKSSSEADVVVKAKDATAPQILKNLESKTLVAGEPGFIEFQVDSPNGDIKFLRNGKHVLPNDRVHIQQLPDGVIRLTFDNVMLDDEGDYTAIFTNNNGLVKSSAPVTVKSKPIITKELVDLTVKEGCATKFEVQIKANPPPTVTWFKNGLDLEADSRQVTMLTSKDDTYFLVLDKCNFRDGAEYSVTAMNDLGEATSKANLNVVSNDKFEDSAPVFLQHLQDMTTKKGDNFTLKAKIKAHPVPDVIWKKDGIPIGKSDNVFINFDGVNIELSVLNCAECDLGTYELIIKNELGDISSKAIVSTQKEQAPKFIKKLNDLQSNLNIATKLVCRVEGFPEPEVSWLFNGRPIESGIKYNIFKELDEQILIVFNPSDSDSGTYECIAKNNLGSDQTSCNVHFTEKDKTCEAAQFLTKLHDYDVLPGGTARFVACVIGNPKPELKWFKDGQEISIDNNKYFVDYQNNGMIKFEIREVCEGDLGKYRCHASNVYGYDNSIAELNFETVDGLDRQNQSHKSQKSQKRVLDAGDIDYKSSGAPFPLPDVPKITKMTDDSLTLIWLPSIPEQPRFPVSYVVEFAKVSDGIWIIYQANIKDTKCDITNLEKFQDYSFRIRVENKFGTSDPSPSVTAFRSKLKCDHQDHKPKEDDFDLKHIPREKIAAAPKFVREEESFMYGICGQPVTIEFWVYGYPEPSCEWLFENQKIEHNEKYNFMQDRNGKMCLFINKMELSDVGYYTCIAKNEHGEEKKTIKLLNAEPPVFTKRLEESTVSSRNHIRLECFVKGTPEPTVKWFKDFQPLHDTSRINVLWESPDHATLVISDSITRDMGLYSCTATNLAGSTTTAAFIHVKETEISYDKYPFSYNKAVKPKNKPLEQFYDLGDELGRGTQGIVYHAVERTTGNNYASKMMHGMGEMKQYMMSELDIMNQLGSHEKLVQIRDAFASTPHSLSLIMDMCGGGTLLDFILKNNSLTENEVANYIQQILEGLHYMHFKNIGHFGLTIGDILMERMNGSDIKICDFGLAHRVIPGSKHYVEFGHPEFVSPEIVQKNSVTFTSDVWSVGIITYILLTGISPFLSENDRCTLQNIQNKRLDLSDSALSGISEQGKDFLHKVLDYDPIKRFDVKSALNHPWLKMGNRTEVGNKLPVIDKLRDYHSKYTKWYQNASCKRYYRRRELHSCYTHPSRMIYPPDEQYSPLISPEREIRKYTKTVSPFENVYPPNQSRDGENFQSESHYQSGPDTYLLQLRDTGFPARIRRYLRIAATSSPSIASNLKQAHWGGNIMASMTGYVPQVSIKERRKFTDVMDEEINDEIKGFSNRNKPMRLVREVGTSSYAHGQLNSLRKEAKTMRAEQIDDIELTMPFFREKLRDIAFQSGDDVIFSCYAIGQPDPTYTWFRNDSILIENSRVEVKRTNDGRCQLRIKPAREYDVGVYKCVARNSQGSVVCRALLSLGDVPGHINTPTIKDGSAHEVLLSWSLPKFLGHTYIQCYKLEYKKVEDDQWSLADENIKQEFYLMTNLQENTSYHFRLYARNSFGWSEPSAPTEVAKTLPDEEDRQIPMPLSMQLVVDSSSVSDNNEQNLIPNIDYSREINPVPLIKSDFKELYDFKSIIANGKFSVVSRAYVKDGSRVTLACKCTLTQSEKESQINNEYEIMKSLAHEKIVKLVYANRDSNMFTLAMELFSGLNVLTYLSRRQFYTEECVSTIICQVLDAIEYLHYKGIGLLELQPDNVLVVDERKLQIKLTDFANARHISSTNNKVTLMANPEYIAPELIRNEEATLPYTDIWSVGVLAYILLSGHSPFQGDDTKQTAQNVVFVRYLFDRLYPQVTQEAIRFLLTVFKLTPHKRPTVAECYESKWLLSNSFMIKKRQMAVFSSTKINEFASEFFAKKSSTHSRLLDLIGLKE